MRTTTCFLTASLSLAVLIAVVFLPTIGSAEDGADLLQRLLRLEARAAAGEAENEELRLELERVRRQLFELQQRTFGDGDPAVVSPDPARGGGGDGAVGAGGDGTERRAPSSGSSLLDSSREQTRRLGTKGGLLAKTFFGNLMQKTTVGGYIDLEYRDPQGSERRFRQHRLNIFIFSEVNEQISFGAEIETEDGGPQSAADDGEYKVEFAFVDYKPSEAFGIRAGAILVPLGKFNVVHDSPVNDLTDRPLVNQYIIPTTLTEAGVGVFGTCYPAEEWKVDYELYLVNGFRGLVADSMAVTGFTSNFDTSSGVRGGRPSLRADNNNSLSGTGRIGVSPFLGTEVGISAHAGRYDDSDDNTLVIWAFDAVIQPAYFCPALEGFEFQCEVARADLSRDSVARASGVPDDMWGFYGQVNYHFLPECFVSTFPSLFGDESTLTAALRLGHVELDDERMQRLTLGLNFRPIEGTVFKVDYQFNFEDWNRRRIHNDAVLFSIASYF